MEEANTVSQTETVAAPVVSEETQEQAPPAANGKEPDPNVTANGERLDRQTRNWRALERDRDHWREMAMRHAKPPEPPPAPPSETAKTLADFNYDEAQYLSYLRKTTTNEAVQAARRELEQERQREEQQRRVQSFRQRETAFSKSTPDYFEVTRDEGIQITSPMAEAIAESDEGPAVAYHLAKNPDIAANIASLSPASQIRELGRLEAKLIAEREKAKEKAVTKAPAPPPKIEAVEPAVTISPDDPASDKLSSEEWFKRRDKQIAKRFKG